MKFTKIDIDECYAYLIVTQKDRAILIDPKLDYAEYYLHILDEKKLELEMVIDTHLHADHLSAGAYLSKKTGATYAMYENTKCDAVTRRFYDNEEFKIDNLNFRIIYTPGHTDNSMCVICEDKIFTGDFIFLDGSGRDDLPTGDSEVHFYSLDRLRGLEEYYVVCPAHNYGANELSSLHQIRKENPVLNCKTLNEFRELTKPEEDAKEWMYDVVKFNSKGNKDINSIKIPKNKSVCQKGQEEGGSLDSVAFITKHEVNELLAREDKPVVLDVREKTEFYEIKPIEGSIFINIKELPSKMEELEEFKGKTFITVCKSGVRATKAAKMIHGAQLGTVFVLKGGIQEYRK
ncbi:MAG: MBL fold metallo-hydrolase [Sarcina sp.]